MRLYRSTTGTPSSLPAAAAAAAYLATRSFERWPSLNPGCVSSIGGGVTRMTPGTPADCRRLVSALRLAVYSSSGTDM